MDARKKSKTPMRAASREHGLLDADHSNEDQAQKPQKWRMEREAFKKAMLLGK